MALVVAGPLIVLATQLQPSRETAATIIASEVRLIAAHVLFTVYGLLSCSASRDSMRLSAVAWDGWDWQAS